MAPESTRRVCAALVLGTVFACGEGRGPRDPLTTPTASTGGDPVPSATAAAPSTPDPSVELGQVQTLLPPNGPLGLSYFPDEGSSVLSYDPFRLVITDGGSKASYLLTSSATVEPLLHLDSAERILEPGALTDFDNGYAGLSAVVQHEGVYYGFYHAEDQLETGTLPGTSIPGFYARVGLATSNDGRVWTKAGIVLESFVPKRVPDGISVWWDQGVAEPGAVISNDGKYIYVYYTEHSRVAPEGGAREVLICVARAELATWPPPPGSGTATLPGVFRKYHAGRFDSDGIGGPDTPVILAPAANANTLEGHVVYSASLAKYVMVYGVDAYLERSSSTPTASVSGLYLAYSDDGVEWRTSPSPLITDFGVAQPGLSLAWQASILWDADSDRAGWLVYGYTPNFDNPPHYMVGRRVTFTR